MDDLFAPKESRLTVLSFGAGQDSTALLEMYLDDPHFRQKYAPNDFLVVMSDTGDEFDQTYQHIEDTKKKCAEAGVEFVLITADMGYHSESWLSLRHFYKTKSAIGSKAFPKVCSSRLKLEPIYRFLEEWLGQRYGVKSGRKNGFLEFASRFGKIQMIIGIAAGEEKRMSDASLSPKRWYRDSIEHVYPLVDLGMDRSACQDLLHSKGLRVIPSNCKACPFLSLEELEYLRRFAPESLEDWVELEANKLAKYKYKESVIVTDKGGDPVIGRNGLPKTKNQNYGVFGVTPLPSKIKEAKDRFSDWSDARIANYRYSHGHCVSTAY